MVRGFLILSVILSTGSFVFAQDDLDYNCRELFSRSGFCPQEVCQIQCGGDIAAGECLKQCVPRPCYEMSVKNCPEDYCQVIPGCAGEDVCYFKDYHEAPPECGEESYFSWDVSCCEGLVRKCGYEFFDGTCDMLGAKSVYSVPICLPCGNGICNQFENGCNCPEDCKTDEYEEHKLKMMKVIVDKEREKLLRSTEKDLPPEAL